jgi:hypothetical protein
LRKATRIPFGPPPTLIVLITFFRFGPIRLTVPEPSFVTQTDPPPYASAYGLVPTLMRACRLFVVAFRRVTRLALRELTQTLPAP